MSQDRYLIENVSKVTRVWGLFCPHCTLPSFIIAKEPVEKARVEL
jgi:hypothetical protein